MLSGCVSGNNVDKTTDFYSGAGATQSRANLTEGKIYTSPSVSPKPAISKSTQFTRPADTIPREVLKTPSPLMNNGTPSLTINTIATPTASVGRYDSGALIQIVSPGEGSRVISPISVAMSFNRSSLSPIILELRGGDGSLIVRQVWSLDNNLTAGSFSENISFEISGSSESGRLSVSQKDEYGRLMSVYSVDLTLLSDSDEVLELSTTPGYGIIIQQPESDAVVSGGVLTVSGQTCLFVDEPLRVLIIAEDGKVVGQRLAGVKPDSDGECVIYSSEVPYTVTETTPVRLIVYQDGNQMSDVKHLSSLVIILEP